MKRSVKSLLTGIKIQILRDPLPWIDLTFMLIVNALTSTSVGFDLIFLFKHEEKRSFLKLNSLLLNACLFVTSTYVKVRLLGD